MIRLKRPRAEAIGALLTSHDRGFNYPEAGATADPRSVERLAREYHLDHARFPLGRGRALFETACSNLLAWRHFDIPWLELHGSDAPLEAGQVVATETRALGLWFVNPCRVVYTENDLAVPDRAAFAYGTLSGHVARGEERFAVRFDPVSGAVAYEILSFSRPAALLAKLGTPWMRRIQRRFREASAEALKRACRPPRACR